MYLKRWKSSHFFQVIVWKAQSDDKPSDLFSIINLFLLNDDF